MRHLCSPLTPPPPPPGLPTYLLPTSDSDGSSWPHSFDYFQVAAGTESSNGKLWDIRPIIFYNMVQRGYSPVRRAETWGEFHNGSNVLIVIDHVDDAVRLRGLLHVFQSDYAHAVRPLIVISGGPGVGRAQSDIERTLGREYNPQICCYVNVFDMFLRKLDAQPYRAVDILTEAMLAMRGIIETTRPSLIIVPHRRGSPVAKGVLEAALEMHVPTAALLLPDFTGRAGGLAVYKDALEGSLHINMGSGTTEFTSPTNAEESRKSGVLEAGLVLAEARDGVFKGGLTDAVAPATQAFALGASNAAASLGVSDAVLVTTDLLLDLPSPGDAPVVSAYAYATTSVALLLRYTEDLLCACERPDSQGIGAYAQCPWRTPRIPTPTP